MTLHGAGLVLGLALALCPARGVRAAENPAGDDHQQMVTVLADIARRSRDENLYTGDAQAQGPRRFSCPTALVSSRRTGKEWHWRDARPVAGVACGDFDGGGEPLNPRPLLIHPSGWQRGSSGGGAPGCCTMMVAIIP
jgi:hypothetical protein